MLKKENPLFISTHTRILISDWPTLAELIIKHSSPPQEETVTSSDNTASTILSTHLITDAMKGPMQAFFKEKIQVYARISELRLYLTLKENDIFKEKYQALLEEGLPLKHILQKISLSDLEKKQKTLDTLTTAHEKEWQQACQQWGSQILNALISQWPDISEADINTFQALDTASKLLERLSALNIRSLQTPSSITTFTTYFHLKAELTTYNVLSRQNRPQTSSTVNHTLKKLKPHFKHITQAEHKLCASHHDSTQQVIKTLY